MKRFALVAALLLSLSGCDTLAVRTVGGPTFLYNSGDLAYAGGGRDMRVVVLEDKTTLFGDHELTTKAAIAGLQKGAGSVTRLTATPRDFNKEFKVVVAFAPPAEMTGGDLCREPKDYRGVSNAGELHVLAVFCRTTDVLTEIDGYASGVREAGDKRFMALMAKIAEGLFPARDLGVGNTPE